MVAWSSSLKQAWVFEPFLISSLFRLWIFRLSALPSRIVRFTNNLLFSRDIVIEQDAQVDWIL